jgi:hypothetical protein
MKKYTRRQINDVFETIFSFPIQIITPPLPPPPPWPTATPKPPTDPPYSTAETKPPTEPPDPENSTKAPCAVCFLHIDLGVNSSGA